MFFLRCIDLKILFQGVLDYVENQSELALPLLRFKVWAPDLDHYHLIPHLYRAGSTGVSVVCDT